ncbi:hypothetical protein [Brevibacterium sp. XM4083]|uniref:hypothetical protein n=1 Tax=Brevibacterium sp. XM4083 TaxID=2583238 RepID=UPI001127559F|nr:hypothetical protein [Brevibacterium sp. XM4083]MCM1011789.1 hypothetical protein [Brevibacterium sp. XM4083]
MGSENAWAAENWDSFTPPDPEPWDALNTAPTPDSGADHTPGRDLPEPEPEQETARIAEGHGTGTPEAIEHEKTATRRASLLQRLKAPQGRGVDWVRPTDLVARSSAAMAGRGIALQEHLARKVDRGLATAGKTAGAYAAKKLPSLKSFGRGFTREPATRSALGRN